MNEAIAEYVKPDKALFQEAQPEVSAFDEAFELKYQQEDENKKKKRIYWKDIIQHEEQKTAEESKQEAEEAKLAKLKIGGGEDGMKFGEEEVKEISSVRPIEDFNKMVSDRKVDRVGTAISQMQTLIERMVKNSLKGDLYPKALECLGRLRETCV